MYPKFNSCRPFYDRCRNTNGGYGGLLSATFHKREHAVTFFDALDTAKGPSLGTNFTLRYVESVNRRQSTTMMDAEYIEC